MVKGVTGSGKSLRRKRLSAEDWSNAALSAILESGVEGVNVEELARTLGVTKGSFYWHYQTRADLLAATLALWERRYTDEYLAGIDQMQDPVGRLRLLIANAVNHSRGQTAYAALSQVEEEPVRIALRHVANRRIAFLERVYCDLGLSPSRARHRARLAYATYIGLMRIPIEAPDLRLTEAEQSSFINEVIEALIPPAVGAPVMHSPSNASTH